MMAVVAVAKLRITMILQLKTDRAIKRKTERVTKGGSVDMI